MAIKIYIDQGHNPENPNAGAEGNGLREQDITYRVGKALAERLRANGNFDVRESRPTPTVSLGSSNSTSLQVRVRDANRVGRRLLHQSAHQRVLQPRRNRQRGVRLPAALRRLPPGRGHSCRADPSDGTAQPRHEGSPRTVRPPPARQCRLCWWSSASSPIPPTPPS